MTRIDEHEALLGAYLDIECPDGRIDDTVMAKREALLQRLKLPADLHTNLLHMRYDWAVDEALDTDPDETRLIRFSSNKQESLKRRITNRVAKMAKPGDIVFSIKQHLAAGTRPPRSILENIKRRVHARLDSWLGNDPGECASWTTMLYLGYRAAPRYKRKKQLFCTHVCTSETRCEHLGLNFCNVNGRCGSPVRKILEFHRYKDKDEAYLSIAERKLIVRKALLQVVHQVSFDRRPRKATLTCALGLPSRPLDPENPRRMVCYDQVVFNYAAAGRYFEHPASIQKPLLNLPTRLFGHPLGHGPLVNPRFSYLHDRTLYANPRTVPILSLHQEAVRGKPYKGGDYVLKIRPPKGHWRHDRQPIHRKRPDRVERSVMQAVDKQASG